MNFNYAVKFAVSLSDSIFEKPSRLVIGRVKALSSSDVVDMRGARKALIDKMLSNDSFNNGYVNSRTFLYKYARRAVCLNKKLSNNKTFQVFYEKLANGRKVKKLQLLEGCNTKELKRVVYDENGVRIEKDYCIHLGEPSRPGIHPPAVYTKYDLGFKDCCDGIDPLCFA